MLLELSWMRPLSVYTCARALQHGGACDSGARLSIRFRSFLIQPSRKSAAPRASLTTCSAARAAVSQVEGSLINKQRARLRSNVHTSLRVPGPRPRHCSSHASSTLVKMATDRDVLPDEYALHQISSMSRLLTSKQRETHQLHHLPLRPPTRRAVDVPRPMRHRPPD